MTAAGPAAGADVLDHLDGELDRARSEAAAAYDRADALADLRSLAHEFAYRDNRARLTVDQLWRAPLNAEEHARLRALVERAFPNSDRSTT